MVGRTPEYLGKKIEKYEVRMAMLAILILFAGNVVLTSLATNVELPPGGTAQSFTAQQRSQEAGLPTTAKWNRVNNSDPSLYYGATRNNVNNGGPHGFSEILYAYCSTTANNGSAFAGLTGNTPYYNLTLGLAMLMGRYLMIIPILAMAGSLARKKLIPASAGTLGTDTGTFALLLAAVVLLVGALEYFPALALGPIVEHFQMTGGRLF